LPAAAVGFKLEAAIELISDLDVVNPVHDRYQGNHPSATRIQID